MTKVTYEIYDLTSGATIMRFTEYRKMLRTLEETKETYRECEEYCPLAYKQVYTPINPTDEKSKNYIKWYKDMFAKS